MTLTFGLLPVHLSSDSNKYGGTAWGQAKITLPCAFGAQDNDRCIMWKTTEANMGALLLLLLVGAAVTVEAGVIERCNGAVVELVPCEDSITGKGSVPATHGCCMALSELLLSPECLCYAATTAQGFDMKQILGLPAACKFHVKPHQFCEGIPIPSYSKPPSAQDLAPSESTELPSLGFSDEIREKIKQEFHSHQTRVDSLVTP